MAPTLELDVLPDVLAVCRLPAEAPVPAWAEEADGQVVSITRTRRELSIVCPGGAVPADVVHVGGWRALHVRGPLDFALVGVVAALTVPLAAAEVPVFLLSTYDSDLLLVADARLEPTVAVLRRAGHAVFGS